MQFVRDGEFFKVARVTGPTHNFLALRFGEADSPNVVILDAEATILLSEENVRKQVLAGVSRANAELGTRYRVAEMQFLRGDTKPEEIYQELAMALTKRMHEDLGR